MSNHEYKALLFDLDGTLIDTNELIIDTFLHVLGEKFPGKYDREAVIPFLGPSLEDTFSSVDSTQMDELTASYKAWNEKMHDEMVVGFEGVAETLHLLKEKGYKLAIVSTKRRVMIEKGLNIIQCQHLFDTIVGLEDVKNTKPDPESLELALQRLGIAKENALMIGDNYHDIVGGQNASVDTAAVAWSIKGEDFLATFHPTYMLHHITDLLAIVEGQPV